MSIPVRSVYVLQAKAKKTDGEDQVLNRICCVHLCNGVHKIFTTKKKDYILRKTVCVLT